MKNNFFLFMLIFMFFILIDVTVIEAYNYGIMDDKKIFNVDVSDKFVVYEHEEIVNGNVIHYLSLYDKEKGKISKIFNEKGEMINSNMYFPSLSDSGELLVFTSRATNITDDSITECYDIVDKVLKPCSNIYLYNIEEKSFLLLKENKMFDGDNYVAKISGNGKYIVFESLSTNFLNTKYDCSKINGISNCINIYKYNILINDYSLISTWKNNSGSNSNSLSPSISYDGRYISFQSNADNLFFIEDDAKYCNNYATNDIEMCSNVYLVDTLNSSIKIISSNNGELFNDNSGNAKISDDGNYVVYESYSTNISNQGNGKSQIVLYSILNSENKIISLNKNVLNNRDNYVDDISKDGKYIIYRTQSTNLDNINNVLNLYVYNSHSLKTSSIIDAENDILFSLLCGEDIIYYDDNQTLYNLKIDKKGPYIDTGQVIYTLIDKTLNLKNKIKFEDNLSAEDMVEIHISDFFLLSSIGEHTVKVTAVDEFENFTTESIKIIVMQKDVEGPVFNDVKEIKILKGSIRLNIANYVEAIDKIDGKTRIYIVDDGKLNLDTAGNYKVKVMSKDASENVTYKEISIIVYENYDFKYFYELILVLSIICIIIFSIIKVK